MKVYRFHDAIAITPTDGPTFYITPGEAEKLADALTVMAHDAMRSKFTESTLSPIRIEQ